MTLDIETQKVVTEVTAITGDRDKTYQILETVARHTDALREFSNLSDGVTFLEVAKARGW